MKNKQQIELNGTVAEVQMIKNHHHGCMLVILKFAAQEPFETAKSNQLSLIVWHTLLLRNEIAYYASVHLKKGDRIKVDANIQYAYAESGGRKKIKTEIKIQSITLLNDCR